MTSVAWHPGQLPVSLVPWGGPEYTPTRLASDGVAPHAVTEVDVTSGSPIESPNSLADTGTSETRNTLSTEAASNQEVNNADRLV
uniref:Uncharacterized protein n=1 Tax=Timema bartmani TaxID=61472 RepID=A0A7R9I8M0_9NEOP|nr:unnamed protein product [Timema bartmani]